MNVLDDPPRTVVSYARHSDPACSPLTLHRSNVWTSVNQHVRQLDTLPLPAQTQVDYSANNKNLPGPISLRPFILEASERLKLPPGSKRKKRKFPSQPPDHRSKRQRISPAKPQAAQSLIRQQELSTLKAQFVPPHLKPVATNPPQPPGPSPPLPHPPPPPHSLIPATLSRLNVINAAGMHPASSPPLPSPLPANLRAPDGRNGNDVGNNRAPLTQAYTAASGVNPRPIRSLPFDDSRTVEDFIDAEAFLLSRIAGNQTLDWSRDLPHLKYRRLLKNAADLMSTFPPEPNYHPGAATTHQSTAKASQNLATTSSNTTTTTHDAPVRPFMRANFDPSRPAGKYPFYHFLQVRHRIPTCFRIPEAAKILSPYEPTREVTFEIFGILRAPQEILSSAPTFIEIADLFFPQNPPYLKVQINDKTPRYPAMTDTIKKIVAKSELLSSVDHHKKDIIRAIVRAIPKESGVQRVAGVIQGAPFVAVDRYEISAYQTFPTTWEEVTRTRLELEMKVRDKKLSFP